MDVLYYVAIVLFAGLIMARAGSKLKLPNVTGYLIGGIIIGPFVLNLVPADRIGELAIISEIALGVIAYSIGSEFNVEHVRKIGKSVIIITLLESLTAVLIVDLVMIFVFKQPVPFSIALGAIAATTAPAATIMVIRQYKAKGPVVSTLLPVVAMDDAVGIMAFGISYEIARTLLHADKSIPIFIAILTPIREIVIALLVGAILGVALSYVSKKARGDDELLCITIGTIFLSIGIAKALGVSTLLQCMMLGATVANVAPNSIRLLSIVERVTPPIFVAFFTIAGAGLDIGILKNVGLIGIGYVIFRAIGKLLGAYAGAVLTDAPAVVQKYLGFTLLPQAGVAIGLAMLAEQTMPEFGAEIKTVILSATVIYELLGPVIAKTALVKAGEIQEG